MPKLSMKYTLCIKYKIKILQNNINFIFCNVYFLVFKFFDKKNFKKGVKN